MAKTRAVGLLSLGLLLAGLGAGSPRADTEPPGTGSPQADAEPPGTGSPQADTEPPGTLGFVARNTLVEAHGTFHRWRVVDADVDRAAPSAGFVEVEVDVASVDTGIRRRDDHLRSADFFDVETWPIARVRVHDAHPAGPSERGNPLYSARFDVTIRDVQRTLEGRFELVGGSRVEGSLVLDRTDFGVGSPRSRWNPLSVHDEVVVRYSARLPAH